MLELLGERNERIEQLELDIKVLGGGGGAGWLWAHPCLSMPALAGTSPCCWRECRVGCAITHDLQSVGPVAMQLGCYM
jgi:hypothetical protein